MLQDFQETIRTPQKQRRDGLVKQQTKSQQRELFKSISQGNRRKKSQKSKKIPEKFTIREYDNNELSSKWDVKMKQLLDHTDSEHYLSGNEKKFGDIRTMTGAQNSLTQKSFFFQRDDELEEDNSKKMVAFFYHGRTFTYCKESCQLFKKEHLIRRISVWITEWNFYKFLTFLTILTMSIFMGLNNYSVSDSENMKAGGYQSIFSYTKYFYIAYFAIEIVLKIIARGLYQSPNTYLRNINNFIILFIFAIITIYDTQFIFLLIFRIFYIFEFTGKIKYLRQSYNILKLYSISADTVCKLFFLIIFFLTLFGILSTNIFSGSLEYRCRTTPIPLAGDWPVDNSINRLCGGRYTCPDNTYCGSNYSYTKTDTSYIDPQNMNVPINQKYFNYGLTNFDNLYQSYITLFQIYMVEGYYNILYMMEDSHDSYLPVMFVTCLFLVCTYFLNNLIIAILYLKYQQIEIDEEKRNFSNKKKSGLVRFQNSSQQQDTLTFNVSSNANQNSVYNHRIAQGGQTDKSNRVYPDTILNMNKDGTGGDGSRSFKKQRSKTIVEAINRGKTTYFKPSIKSINNDEKDLQNRERKITYDTFLNLNDENRKLKSLFAFDIIEKGNLTAGRTEQQGIKVNTLSSIPMTGFKKKQSRIPMGSSIVGQSFMNIFQLKNSMFGKNGYEEELKEQWNEKLKDYMDIGLNNKSFIFFMNFCIFVNLVILSFNQYPAPSNDLYTTLKRLNFAFIVMFLIEDFMRLFSNQQNYYIILFSEIIVDIVSVVLLVKTQDLVPFSALKGLRILYVFTNFKQWVHYTILIDAINHSMSSVLNIMLILFSFMYLGTIIGMWLFGGKLKFDNEGYHDMNGNSPRFNFDNILSAFTTVFAVMQGDQWNNIWMDCVRSVGGLVAQPYFFLLIILGRLVVITSITSIMLTSFEYAKKKSELGMKSAKAIIDQLSTLKYHKKNIHALEEYKQVCKAAVTKGKLTQSPPQLGNTAKSNIAKSLQNLNHDQEFKEDENMKYSLEGDSEQVVEKHNNKQSQPYKDNKIDLDYMATEGIVSPFQNPIQDLKTPVMNQYIMPLKRNDSDEYKKDPIIIPPSKNGAGKGGFKGQQQSQPMFSPSLEGESTPNMKKSNFSHSINSLKQKKQNSISNKEAETAKAKEIQKLGKIGYYLKYCSCFLFHKDSTLRHACMRLITFQLWDKFFLVVFCLEAAVKIIANGFLYNFTNPSKAYLRSSWNILDLFVNVSAIVDLSGVFSTQSLKSLKSLRVLRALRPLRIISKNESLKLLVNALFQTVPILTSLAFVTLTATWIFAIFLMSQFKGQFQFCSFPNIYEKVEQTFYQNIVTVNDCVTNGGTWQNQYFNYDTIFLSIISLFKVILGENWSLLMWASVDSSGINQQPVQDYNRGFLLLYILLLFMGNIFTINLFTGLVVNNFKRIKDDISGYNNLSNLQRQWVEMQKYMMKRKLKVVIPTPENSFRNICFELAKSTKFEKIIIFFILVNLVTMGCQYKGINAAGSSVINVINNTCLIIYHIEAFIKMSGVGVYFYFKDDWNNVIAVTDAVLFSSLFVSLSAVSNLPVIFRALRLGRIVKYIRASQSLKILIDSIYYLLPSLINIAFILFLFVFICAILGMNLFSQTMLAEQSSSYPFFDERVSYPYSYNFQTITGSFLVVLQCIQNQNWDWYMSLYGYDQSGCYNQSYADQQKDGIKGCSNPVSFPFYVVIVFFVRYIIINLFLALVVEGFFDTLKENEAVISPDVLEQIIEKWSEYDQNGTGFIYPEEMYCLLLDIPEPIGLKNEFKQHQPNKQSYSISRGNNLSPEKKNKLMFISRLEILEQTLDYNVRLYSNDKTHFMDFCVKLSRNAITRKALANKEIDPFLVKENLLIKNKQVEKHRVLIQDSLLEGLMKNWEAEFPSLKKYNKRKDEFNLPKRFFNVREYFSAITIQDYIRSTQRQKKIKEQIMKNKINSKMQKTGEGNPFAMGNIAKQKAGIGRNYLKKQVSKSYINQPLSNNNPIITTHQPPQPLITQTNELNHLINDDYNLDTYNFSTKQDKSFENTPQKLNKDSKAQFFQKIANSANGKNANQLENDAASRINKNQNQESLRKFQQFHNFQIKSTELGQKFPIKYATDYESLRPQDLPKRIVIEDFALINNESIDLQGRNRTNTKIGRTPNSNINNTYNDKKRDFYNTPKNYQADIKAETPSRNQKEQFYQLRDMYSYKNKSPQHNNLDLQERQSREIILERSSHNENNSQHDEQSRNTEFHSTEVDPSLISQKNIQKNNFFIN